MGKARLVVMVVIMGAVISIGVWIAGSQKGDSQSSKSKVGNLDVIELPEVEIESSTSVEEALLNRRSIREYAVGNLSLTELGQLLWAAQGITKPDRGFRTAPSAGGLYPLELFIAAGDVTDLPAGVYRYAPANHALIRILERDVRLALSDAALGQESIRNGGVWLDVPNSRDW